MRYVVRQERGFATVHRVDLAWGETSRSNRWPSTPNVDRIVACPEGDRVALVASAPHIPPRVVIYDASSQAAAVVTRSSGENVPRAELAYPRAGELADGGRRDRSRLALRAAQPALRGGGRAAAGRARSRGADQPGARTVGAVGAVLRHAGLRRADVQLSRQHRFRPRLHAAAATETGACVTSRTPVSGVAVS